MALQLVGFVCADVLLIDAAQLFQCRAGGIEGQAKGLYCNSLRPLERVLPALENCLQTIV